MDTAEKRRRNYFRRMADRFHPAVEIQPLLSRLCDFCIPGGSEGMRSIRGVRTTQRGQMRMAPEARWIPFTAEEFVNATTSNFRWEARLDPGKLASTTVIDGYKQGHGYVLIKLGGLIPIKKIMGPDADRGELQRYLGSAVFCPPMLLNHASLVWSSAGKSKLRVRDSQDASGATLDWELSEDGSPICCRADRPRMVGRTTVVTPWVGMATEYREYEGLRIATQLQVAWMLPEGEFTYFRSEIESFAVVR